MSRSCAKPTCSSPAVSWFDLSRETREVARSTSASEQGIALCQVHADRFSVPVGWSLTVAAPEPDPSQSNTAVQSNAAVDEVTPNREHDRENPWFVPAAHIDAAADIDADEDSLVKNPSAGSLLDRAFNGPATDDVPGTGPNGKDRSGSRDTVQRGSASAPQAPVDELSPRRRARSSSDDAEEESTSRYHEFELPFPPHGRRIAVS